MKLGSAAINLTDYLCTRWRKAEVSNELILIIEDDASSRKLLRDTLQVAGYQTMESASAEIGLRIAEERRPALILMDIRLPGMGGVEALRHLRRDPVTRSIAVIAVTASVVGTQSEVARAGFDGLETKPVSIIGLLRKIRAAIDRGASPALSP
jgi:two-component system cell cycle response regulator DivK